MRGNKILLESEDHWATKMGAWLPEKGTTILRGKDIFHDLKGISWMGYLLYGITGRLFDEKSLKLFEGIWTISISYPEPRLWPNRIPAFAGIVRSTCGLGMAGGIASDEGINVGHRTNIRVVECLQRIKTGLDGGLALDELVALEVKKYGGIPGYGRPINPQKDERIEPLMNLAQELGFADGYYVKLSFQIEEVLTRPGRRPRYMNISGLAGALVADQGLSAKEHYYYFTLGFTAGMLPCYIDAAEHPEGSFFPLRCSRIRYKGKERRTWDK